MTVLGVMDKDATMASQRPTKQFLLQCPLPWCGKGFNDVPQIQKHISMSARCGMYLQKLLHAQSQTFGKPSRTTCAPQTITNMNQPFAVDNVCFPINHQEPDNFFADKDALIMDEPSNVENRNRIQNHYTQSSLPNDRMSYKRAIL